MMQSVKEASQRWRTQSFDNTLQRVQCMSVLANAYIAEHLADDDEPITEAWLLSVGFDSKDGLHRCVGFKTDLGEIFCAGLDHVFVWSLFNLDFFPGPHTRGEVRLLFKVLKYELKESKETNHA
jgi:hypothetical protein